MAQGCLKGWLAIPWYGFSAIHTTYRNWLRSSSMHEPRDPPSEVVKMVFLKISSTTFLINNFVEPWDNDESILRIFPILVVVLALMF